MENNSFSYSEKNNPQFQIIQSEVLDLFLFLASPLTLPSVVKTHHILQSRFQMPD